MGLYWRLGSTVGAEGSQRVWGHCGRLSGTVGQYGRLGGHYQRLRGTMGAEDSQELRSFKGPEGTVGG